MSANISKRRDFGFKCTTGTWYACATGSKFVGCCDGTEDPCSTGCSDGHVRPAKFDATQSEKFPDASCDNTSDFYSCKKGSLTFWGCCKSNPCGSSTLTCPAGDLTQAFLDQPDQVSAYKATSAATYSTASSTVTLVSTAISLTTTSATISSTPMPTITSAPAASATAASASAVPSPQSTQNDKNMIILASSVAGGGVALAMVVGLVVYFIMHTKKSRSQHRDQLDRRVSDLSEKAIEKREFRRSRVTEAPPVYKSPAINIHAFSQPPRRPKQHTYSQLEVQHFELPGTPASPNHMQHIVQAQRPQPSSDSHSSQTLNPDVSPLSPPPQAFGTPRIYGSSGDQPSWGTHSFHGQPGQAWTTSGNDGRVSGRPHPGFQGYHGI